MLVALQGQSLTAFEAGHRDDPRHLGLCHHLVAVPNGCSIVCNLIVWKHHILSLDAYSFVSSSMQ